MLMQISWHDKSPIYRQLSETLRDLILEGVYQDGESLPSVRAIAGEYRINPITVSRAFQTLVDDELVESRRGLGMFVQEGAHDRLIAADRAAFIEQDLPKFRDRAERLGFSMDDLLKELL